MEHRPIKPGSSLENVTRQRSCFVIALVVVLASVFPVVTVYSELFRNLLSTAPAWTELDCDQQQKLGCTPPLLFPYARKYKSPEDFIADAPVGCELFAHGGRLGVLEQLRGKHLVFIGDSVLRYQFRSLVYSLHFGHTRVKLRPGNATLPSETWERQHGTYNRYYQRMQAEIPPSESFSAIAFAIPTPLMASRCAVGAQ